MNVMLIQPPMPAYGVCTPATYPPLGQILIASYLSKDVNIELIDGLAHPEDCEKEVLKKKVEEFKPDIVGIRIMFISYLHAIEIARTVKSVYERTLLVVGGPHASLLGEEILHDNQFVDLVTFGEGEISFCELVETVSEAKNDFSIIHNVIYRNPKDNRKATYTSPSHLVQLGKYLPRYSLLDMDYYTRLNLMTIEGHRGCSNCCIFCGLPYIQGAKIRYKPIPLVINEIREIVKYGITQIEFVEPNFTVNKPWVEKLCECLIRQSITASFVCRTYVDLVSPDILTLMRKAGFTKIFYGIETGSQKILEEYKRSATIEDSFNAIRWTKETGITACVNYVIGSPSETKETVWETIRNAKALDADDIDISILAPFPGTPLYNDTRIKIKDKHWYKKHEYVLKFPWFSVHDTLHLSAADLQTLWLDAVREIKGTLING